MAGVRMVGCAIRRRLETQWFRNIRVQPTRHGDGRWNMKVSMRRTGIAVLIAAVVYVFASPPAAAYLDPGSGSYLIQLLIGSLLGAGLAIKMFWGRIVSFFTRSKPTGAEASETEGSEAEAPSAED